MAGISLKTVIIDDDESIAEWLAQILEQHFKNKLKITIFTEVKPLMQFLSENTVEILISDVCMPGTFGDFLVLEQLNLNRSTRTILMTGYPKITTFMSSFKDGVDGVILKPFSDQEVITAIQPCIDILENWHSIIHLGKNRVP